MKADAQQRPEYVLTALELSKLTGQNLQELFQSAGTGTPPNLPPPDVKRMLQARGVKYNFTVIAHINLKGGVGKTISAITVATRAVQYGWKTCVVDMDSQGSASLAFDLLPTDGEPIFCDVWQRPDEMVRGALKPIGDSLALLPSSLENGLLDMQLMNPHAQKHAVRGVCDVLRTQGFDLVMIDCPPSLGTAVISTICAADVIVIPVSADLFALKGLEFTLQEVRAICETFHLALPTIHILYTRFDRRLKLSLDIFEHLKATYPDMLLPVPIRTSSLYANMLAQHKTIFATTQKSSARQDYDAYVRHLLGLEHIASQRR